MAKITVYNLKRESVGEIELSDEVFAREVNEGLLHEVVRAQLASRRSGNASTKTRSETNGTTKKIYKQKGTGSARHGDRGAPNFVGGGQSHGPKPRSYAFRPNRKARIGAMQSALALKLKEGRLTVVDAFELAEIKTKQLAGILDKLEVARGSLIVDGPNDKLRLSARNLAGHQVLPPEGVNVYDVLRHEHLVLTKSAAQALEARLKG
ncbi:MAG: 50S ribosomal protein L4 [Sandaracinus sp.]